MNFARTLSDVLLGITGTVVLKSFRTTLPFPLAGQKRKGQMYLPHCYPNITRKSHGSRDGCRTESQEVRKLTS